MEEASILERIYRAHRKLSELESARRDYGTGDMLYSTDVHTLAAIDQRPGCNLTELATALAVSKPAAVKFVKKLERLGYVTREMRAGSEKELSFGLSAKGRRAEAAHRRFEERTFAPLRAVEAALSAEKRKTVIAFLDSLEGAIGW
jgi:DNA-binding MarR family transcriptional regulator